jgi:hypothetical protein
MSDATQYTLDEAQLIFAKKIHGSVWTLLEKSDRSAADDEEMVDAAHASLFHWRSVGTGLNHQRGEWLIARVYTVIGEKYAAMRHAIRCLALTSEHKDLMVDFDIAFAYECTARAYALNGNKQSAQTYKEKADQAGKEIADAEDRKYFFSDLESGPWYILA